jgi:hypothetical protein
MGIKTKLAKGPNPMSMRKKISKDSKKKMPGVNVKDRKRRLRKGKRDRKLSQVKKASSIQKITCHEE